MKSKWKVPYVNKNLISKFMKNDKNIKIWSRSSIILPEFVNKTVYIHNGKKFNKLNVTSDMVGLKFGQFSFTRRLGRIHNK